MEDTHTFIQAHAHTNTHTHTHTHNTTHTHSHTPHHTHIHRYTQIHTTYTHLSSFILVIDMAPAALTAVHNDHTSFAGRLESVQDGLIIAGHVATAKAK